MTQTLPNWIWETLGFHPTLVPSHCPQVSQPLHPSKVPTSKFFKFYYKHSQFYSICSAPIYSSLIYPIHFHIAMGARNKCPVPHTIPPNCILSKQKIQWHDLKKKTQNKTKTPHSCLLPCETKTSTDIQGLHPLKRGRNTLEKPQRFFNNPKISIE